MTSDPLKRRILIGEPDAVHRARLQQLLAAFGYGMEFCVEGRGALRLLQGADAPFAALLDLNLPGMNCGEICQALSLQSLKTAPPETSPWIIAMCDSNPDSPFQAELPKSALALQPGICDLLAKPVKELELQLRLQTAERVQALKDELKRSIEAVGFQSSHDPLTGLWNREALLPLLFQETDRVRRTSAPMALMLIDLDHFMQRNLEFGYDACDSVLRQLAVRIRGHLRSYDILGRSGEDEFLVALPGCAPDDAVDMAERLRAQVMHSPFHARAASLTVRASFGVAQSRGRSPLIVLREAEHALAAAKQAGRDRVRCFQPEPSLSGALWPSVYEGTVDRLPETNRVALFPTPSHHKREGGH